jgi:hypothetical protein
MAATISPLKKRVAFDDDVCSRGRVTGSKRLMVVSSDSDSEAEFEEWKRKKRREAETSTNHRSTEHQWSTPTPLPPTPVPHLNPPSSQVNSTPVSSVPPPMRVNVQIESHSYRIPCPAKVGNKDTPISWLVAQASKRYFSQRGKRPVLELTTKDGASLFESDPISYVLSQDEEVVGVVKDWVCPPLAERYHTSCKVAGVGTLIRGGSGEVSGTLMRVVVVSGRLMRLVFMGG